MLENTAYQICRFLFAPVFRMYFHPVIVNRERIPAKGRVILAGNHKHALDPILIDCSTLRTVHALAKSELFDGPFGFFFRMIKAIPVDLEAAGNPAAYASARSVLQRDEVINISPEAARNYTDQILLPFKTGAVRLARETGAPILPYCIVGDYRFRSGNLKIVFGEPLEIHEDDVRAANQKLYDAVEALLKENQP